MVTTGEWHGPGDRLSLDGQRALVTGASGNIGRGIARRLALAGAELVVHYHRDAEGAHRTVAEIRAGGGHASEVQADLSDAAAVETMFARLADTDTPLQSFVNNAAVQPVRALADMTGPEWREIMATNVDSAFHVTRAATRYLRARRLAGSIVNIASIEGLDPAVGHSHYASSKAALIMLTRGAALEYGRDGIRVNAVSPGLIDRDGLDAAWPDGVRRWLDKVPLGGLGDASDVADAALFLLSPAARWISGANLVVDGGMSAVPRW